MTKCQWANLSTNGSQCNSKCAPGVNLCRHHAESFTTGVTKKRANMAEVYEDAHSSPENDEEEDEDRYFSSGEDY